MTEKTVDWNKSSWLNFEALRVLSLDMLTENTRAKRSRRRDWSFITSSRFVDAIHVAKVDIKYLNHLL